MTALVGLLAVGLDGGLLLVEYRHAQETADAAALGAANSLYQRYSTDNGLDPTTTHSRGRWPSPRRTATPMTAPTRSSRPTSRTQTGTR
jgi:uncharacterized membrane protein